MASQVRATVPRNPSEGVLVPALFLPDLKSQTPRDALREIVGAVRDAMAIEDLEEPLRILLSREILGSTAVGKGVAIPHGRSMVVPNAYLAVARSVQGVPWLAPDGEDVHLIFLLLAPDASSWRKPYLEHLAWLAGVAAQAASRRRLSSAADLAAVQAILKG